MTAPFIYDTHYQIDKPFALLDLTLATTSPTGHSSDEPLARRLSENTKKHRLVRGIGEWKLNAEAMLYWLDNCHQTELLSRQNTYDYWLMNFVWAGVFRGPRTMWGYVGAHEMQLAKLLLLRWAWLFDAPLLIGFAKKMEEMRTCDVGAFVDMKAKHIEEILVAAFAAAREHSSSIRERTAYRAKRDAILRKPLQYNTRRHKAYFHVAVLSESGLIVKDASGGAALHPYVLELLRGYGSLADAVSAAMRNGTLGPGSELFREIVQGLLGKTVQVRDELDDAAWTLFLPEIRPYWAQILKWDRKFLGIRALSELFLVKRLISGSPAITASAWQTYLCRRAVTMPEEVTVHVDRFGRVEFLRLETNE